MSSELIIFISSNLSALTAKTAEHIFLTVIAVGTAIIIGVPLAISVRHTKFARNILLSFVGVLQTIPSLAMLAFFIPIFGIGSVPAIIALMLYAFLPIVRNTITGLEGIDDDLLSAADGLGFKSRERLFLVELPLALPVIVAGIRTATVISVGVATLAAFIGAGGLGDFITRGLAVNSNQLILLGAIPAALLALLFDFLLSRIEKILSPQIKRDNRQYVLQLSMILATVLLLVLPVALHFREILVVSNKTKIRIASKNFTEQFILAELMAQLIEESTELKVDRRINLGSVIVCHRALIANEIDLYPEYTGTGYRVILKQKDNLGAEDIYKRVKETYQKRFNLTWLKPFGFNNTFAVAVREEFARKHNLKTISDLRKISSDLRFVFTSEFHERPDGFKNFIKTYNLDFKGVLEMDLALTYKAVKESKAEVLIANSTDGRIPAFNLRVLEDDMEFFPPYYAAPVIRSDFLKEHPELRRVLNLLADKIDAVTMRRLNSEVDQNKRSPKEVAREFIKNKL